MKVPFFTLEKIHKDLKSSLVTIFEEALLRGVFSGGKEIEKFELAFSRFLGREGFIACSNGTDAMEIALRVLDVKPGDEIIFPELSCQATLEPALLLGCKPVFCPVSRDNLLLDAHCLTDYITTKTKAVVGVHLYGNLLPSEELAAICHDNNLFYVEDCAHVTGGYHRNGKHAGCFADAAIFSFYPTKNLGALGEAGGLIFREKQREERARMWVNHGQIAKNNHEFPGRNARLDTLQALFLLEKLPYIKQWVDERQHWVAYYNRALNNIVPIHSEAEGACHLAVISVQKRSQLMAFLQVSGIETAIHYPYNLPQIANIKWEGFPVDNLLSLPLFPGITKDQIDFVIEKITIFLKSH